MKAYQVFEGDIDTYGRQTYELVATYLDKEKALQHCKEIAEATPLHGDVLEEREFNVNGRLIRNWCAIGWGIVDIARFVEIEIIE